MALTELDRTLLKRCLDRQPGAWENFVDRFLRLFVHVIQHTAHVRSIKLSAEDTDDCCAQIFMTLLADDFAVLRAFRGESSLATYLSVIGRRVTVRELSQRRKAEEMGHVSAHIDSVERAQASGDGQNTLDDREEIEWLLKNLSPRDAEVVRLYHLQGKSYREISETLRIPENSIGPTLTRAREVLRRSRVATESSSN